MVEIRFHPQARAEYEEALAWYRSRSELAADRFEAEAERTVDAIAATPGLFPRYDDRYQFALLRRYPFSLVYEVLPDSITVIAVPHSRRSPGYWRGRG